MFLFSRTIQVGTRILLGNLKIAIPFNHRAIYSGLNIVKELKNFISEFQGLKSVSWVWTREHWVSRRACYSDVTEADTLQLWSFTNWYQTKWSSIRHRWVPCSPRDPRFAGSNRAEIDGFFQDVKILRPSPPGGTLSWGSRVWDFRLVVELQAWKNRPLSKSYLAYSRPSNT